VVYELLSELEQCLPALVTQRSLVSDKIKSFLYVCKVNHEVLRSVGLSWVDCSLYNLVYRLNDMDKNATLKDFEKDFSFSQNVMLKYR